MKIETEKRQFLAEKSSWEDHARQTAAVAILGNIDLAAGLTADKQTRKQLATRIGRLIERERLRGVTRQWSYNLDRHIALKRAYDRIVQF